MNSKMIKKTPHSYQQPNLKQKQKQKKQTTRTGTESQKWNHMEGYQWGSRGRMGEKVQGIRSINNRYKIRGS